MRISWIASLKSSVRTTPDALSLLALPALAGLAYPGALAAQDPSLVDQGRFDILVAGAAVGTETFAVRRQGEGFMGVGRLQIDGSVDWLRSAEFGMRTDGGLAPIFYEMKAGSGEASLRAARTGTRISITRSTPEGDRISEMLADPNQVLIEQGVALHYFFVVRRLMAGSGDRLKALVPRQAREVAIRVAAVRDDPVAVGDERRPARRYELMVGDSRHIVWADPVDGRILRVELPDRQWVSVRRAGD